MPESQAKQPTLRDVADVAGVSYQTVWRVVNQQPHVATDTRERVQQAVQRLDYRPNRAAQVLITGRSYILQLIVFQHGYDPSVLAMLHWARELGYTIAVTELKEPKSTEAVRELLAETANMVDGVLMVTPSRELSFSALADLCQNLPFVLVSTELGVKMPSVVFDQRHGTEEAVDHLLSLGHRRIAEISGPLENFDALVRHETLMSLLEAEDLTPGPNAMGDWSVASGYKAAKQLIESGEEFTALFVGNDRMAFGAIKAFEKSGICVPTDVSVVGFDDIEIASYFCPALTTVRQDFAALGKESVEYLIALIEDPNTPVQQRVLYPELVVRQSTEPVIMPETS